MTFRCFDRVPDLALQDLLDREQGPLEAAGNPRYYWPAGATLRVRFLDGPIVLRHAVMRAAAEWTSAAHLRFAVVADGPADIRVTFHGDGNWSAVGTLARRPEMFAAGEPTMCLAEAPNAAPDRVAMLARHEFGHAIGLLHEHSSPAAGIGWNRPVVYGELAGPPNHWTRAMVEHNVFARYAADRTQFTTFDPASVMLYPIPPHWTTDGTRTAENLTLSPTDRAFAARIYPRP